MSKNFGNRKAFRGHFVTTKEMQELAKEYAASTFQALALNHPLRLVTLPETDAVDETKEMIMRSTGLPFFTVASPKFDGIKRYTTMNELRDKVLYACRTVISTILDLWKKDYTGPIYLLVESQLGLTPKEDLIEVTMALHIAGAKKEGPEAPSEELAPVPVGELEVPQAL